jgi:energy-coupling factor transporter ATP-binding protein EcfA2
MESVAGSLLEREREEELLARVRDSAQAGEGALVLVEGPAGIGKSSLLASATRCAREEGMAVAFARGSSLERGFSFGVALQLFGPLLGSEGPVGPRRSALRRGAGSRAVTRPRIRARRGGRGRPLDLRAAAWALLVDRRPRRASAAADRDR